MGLADLAVGAKQSLVRTQDAAFGGDEIEGGSGSDQLGQEVLGIWVVRRDLIGEHAHIARHERDIGRVEGQSLVFDEDGDAAKLVAEGDARRLGSRVDLERLLDEAAGREAKGQNRGSRTGEGEDASGCLHLVGDAAHHVHEFLAGFAVGVVGVPLLLFEVLVAFGAVPAL